eukprot:TRINITY_DN6414_c0_g1_i1.p1 TRINITY_DN6414_c0_g1~~TRINITY_DN6414_c0_g1_i1.p1  ORF type:complete len:213 (+),score=67.06 TRINITY_DN6414_c0_g1_i1:93-731(+)
MSDQTSQPEKQQQKQGDESKSPALPPPPPGHAARGPRLPPHVMSPSMSPPPPTADVSALRDIAQLACAPQTHSPAPPPGADVGVVAVTHSSNAAAQTGAAAAQGSAAARAAHASRRLTEQHVREEAARLHIQNSLLQRDLVASPQIAKLCSSSAVAAGLDAGDDFRVAAAVGAVVQHCGAPGDVDGHGYRLHPAEQRRLDFEGRALVASPAR